MEMKTNKTKPSGTRYFRGIGAEVKAIELCEQIAREFNLSRQNDLMGDMIPCWKGRKGTAQYSLWRKGKKEVEDEYVVLWNCVP